MEGIRDVGMEQVRNTAGYRQAVKAGPQVETAPIERAVPQAAASVDRHTGRANQAEAKMQGARQALQAGEAALREVLDGVKQMEDLAGKAAVEESPDREALGEELSKLKQELMRIMGGGALGNGLLSIEGSSGQSGINELPMWLLWGISNSPDPDQLLAALGLDKSASGSEIMAAIKNLPLDDPGAGYLAAVYLGAVIAGGGSDKLDPETAAQGLLRLLEAMQNGLSSDEAVSELTDGLFESLEDFQRQFLDGLAPGMEAFFSNLLLGGSFSLPDLMDLLSGGGTGDVDLLMTLLAALDAAEGMPLEPGSEGAETVQDQSAQQAPQSQNMGGTMAEGRDLSGVSYDAETRTVTIGGNETVALRGQDVEALDLTGQGQVELEGAGAKQVAVNSPQAQLHTGGETHMQELSFGEKTALTLSGTGLTHIGGIKGGPDSVLHLKEGAFVLERQDVEPPVRVVIDGAVVLQAPRESHVFNALGEELEPYDLMWKTMFPGWSSIEGMTIDGRHAQMALLRNAQPDIARLWLLKGDPSQGYPAHLIALEGRGMSGELRTRYVYLQWSRMQRKFIPISMFPNPFTVTGGEEDIDWRYEEDSRTLRVLTGNVTGLTGGTGTDAGDRPFSGRLALADGIGRVELTLDGEMCSVPSGRACSLGGGNRVTLLLKRGTESVFESGAGCAGISLGDGTSLSIDQTGPNSQPEGSLTAKGGAASPGIGRDRGRGGGQSVSIIIRGGRVTAIEGRRASAGSSAPRSAIAGLRASARALRLDAMDISTKEAAKEAVKQLSAGRRWVNRLQEAYRAVYGKLGQSLSDPGSIKRYANVVQNGEEAGALMWEMRQELAQSPMGVYGQWETDDVDQMLKAMENMINQ